jgi:hypothetical protein
MKKIVLILGVLFFIGCGETKQPQPMETVSKLVDVCELSYQKCEAECQISTINQEEWKKMACEAKCKTLYGACQTKKGAVKGYNYTKEKSMEGYQYIKLKINE